MVPGITHIFVQNYMEQCLKIYIKKAITDRYNILGSIDAHKKQQPSSIDNGRSGGGNVILSNSTTERLYSLGKTFDFID